MRELGIDDIRIDGGTQPRVHLNESAVAEYAEALTDGVKLPEVAVYFDGSEYWLADGFHRYFAHKKIGALTINAEIRDGSRRDAVLHSVGANSAHGLRRTNDDKRRAVETLVSDDEWGKWSDRDISRACGVSVSFVGAVRRPTVAERQQANRDKSAAKRVESDSAKSVASPQPTPEPEPAELPAQAVSLASEVACDDFGPSDEEMAFHAEKEKSDQEAYDALIEVALSDEKLGEALKLVAIQADEIGRLRAELRVVKEARDSHMNAKNEAIRMVKSLQAKLKKLEKAAA